MVDAWDSTLSERYYDMSFPREIDRSNSGAVYYVMEPGSYDLSAPMDVTDYNAWQAAWQNGTEPIEISYLELNTENLERLKTDT